MSRRGGRDGTGWPGLTRLYLRTGRLTLGLWLVVIGVLVASTALSVAGLYDTPERRLAYRSTVSSSAVGLAFNGRGYALDTVGGIALVELGFYVLLVFPVVAAHLAIRFTRTEEAAGRLELLGARRVGRTAPLRAALLTTTLALGGIGLLTWGGLAVAGLPVGPSGRYALGLALLMAVFAGVGLVTAQLGADARTAHSLALAVIGVVFLVRAVIDVRGWPLTWLTPTGWLAELRPFDAPRSWPLVALALAWIALLLLATWLNGRRDLGSGVIQPRPGPARADAALGTPAGLLARLTRATFVFWAVASVLWAFCLGVIAREMRSLVETNPEIARMLGPLGTEPERLMLALAALFVGLLACGFLAMAVVALAGEETADRLGVVLATQVGRGRWWSSAIVVLAAQAGVIVLVGGVGLGVGAAIGLAEPDRLGDGVWWSATYLPGVWLAGALMMLVIAVSPAGRALGWALFAWMLTVAMLAETLRMPPWLRDTSPLQHVPRVPAAEAAVGPLAVLLALAVAVAVLAGVVFRRRDVGSHAPWSVRTRLADALGAVRARRSTRRALTESRH